MELQLSAERQAQLTDYAQRHGQEPAVRSTNCWRARQRQSGTTIKKPFGGIRRGYADVRAGRTRPGSEFMNELRAKHGF